jgi:hypothetical protein
MRDSERERLALVAIGRLDQFSDFTRSEQTA